MLKMPDSDCPATCKFCCGETQNYTPAEKRAVTVALVGQPNTGKSTVFNMLTGESQHVGNWPGKTVEKKEGRVLAGDKEIYIYDLPGTYSLTANSLEEKIARDFLLQEQCDVVVVVVDAGQLERSLYILAEVVSLGIPVIVVLNKMDVAQKRNAVVNPEMFSQKTGLVVIPVTASRYDGITELLEAILHFDSSPTLQSDRFPEINIPHFDAVLQKIQGTFSQGPSAYWLAGKLIEGDDDVAAMLAGQLSSERWQEIQVLLPSPEQGQLAMATARYDWIRNILPCLVTGKPAQYRRSGFDIAATHPFLGKMIALAVLFFGVIAAYLLALPLMIPGFAVFFLAEPLQQFLSGVFPLPLCSLLCDGLMGGLSLALILLGFIGGVSLVLGLLDNSGYLARLAYCFDPFMGRIGLHGKSIMLLVMGFVCNILGVVGSRVIDSWKQRLITLAITPIIPCKGVFVVVSFIIAVFFGMQAPFVFLGLAVVTVIHLAISSLFLQKYILGDQRQGLLMELPPYHLPTFRNIKVFTVQRMRIFYHQAFWVIVAACVIVWCGIYFPNGSITDSYLAQFGKKLEFLGQIVGWDWRFCITFLVAIFSKEATLGTMAVIFSATTTASTDIVGMAMDQGLLSYISSGDFNSFLAATGLSRASALSFVFALFFSLPCFGTLAAVYSETRSVLITAAAFCYYSFVSLMMGGLAYLVGLAIF